MPKSEQPKNKFIITISFLILILLLSIILLVKEFTLDDDSISNVLDGVEGNTSKVTALSEKTDDDFSQLSPDQERNYNLLTEEINNVSFSLTNMNIYLENLINSGFDKVNGNMAENQAELLFMLNEAQTNLYNLLENVESNLKNTMLNVESSVFTLHNTKLNSLENQISSNYNNLLNSLSTVVVTFNDVTTTDTLFGRLNNVSSDISNIDKKLDELTNNVDTANDKLDQIIVGSSISSRSVSNLASAYEYYYQVTNPSVTTEEKMQFVIDWLDDYGIITN